MHPRPLGPEPSALLSCATLRCTDRGGLAPQTLEGPHPLSRRRPAPDRVHDPLVPDGGSRTLSRALMRRGSRSASSGKNWRSPRRGSHPRPRGYQPRVLLIELRGRWGGVEGLAPSSSGSQPVALLLELHPPRRESDRLSFTALRALLRQHPASEAELRGDSSLQHAPQLDRLPARRALVRRAHLVVPMALLDEDAPPESRSRERRERALAGTGVEPGIRP